MGKKWTNETKILFEKKKEHGISRLTIACCSGHKNNKYQLIYDGKHVGFFSSWVDAFQIIDEIPQKGIELVRDENRIIKKTLEEDNGKLRCYRCHEFKDKEFFKWGHKYCKDCVLLQKKEYYYLKKYEISTNRYSSFENYFQTLLNKRGRKYFLTLDDLMSVLESQNYKCAITQQDFELTKGSPKIPSIDRIIPSKNGGQYNKDNIQIIWHGLNSFKSAWSMEFLYECCEYIYSNRLR
jgi:hypothetical protein